MSRADRTRLVLLTGGICVVWLLIANGCSQKISYPAVETIPVTTPEFTTLHPLPTPTSLPLPTPPPCYELDTFPPLCDIIPGQSTIDDVERIFGPPRFTQNNVGRTHIPTSSRESTSLMYAYAGVRAVPALEIVVDSEVVIATRHCVEIRLEQAVAVYGPPAKVQAYTCHSSYGVSDASCSVALLWPAEGVLIVMRDYWHVSEFLEIHSLSNTLTVDSIWHFPPTTLETIWSTYPYAQEFIYDDPSSSWITVPLVIDWPGMTWE